MDFNTIKEQVFHLTQRLMGNADNEGRDPSEHAGSRLLSSEEVTDPNCFYNLLPYQYVDEQAIFVNKHSVGFGFIIEPSAGADEALVKALANLIKSKIPDGVEVQCSLLSHPWIGARLDDAFASHANQDDIFSILSERAKVYHQQAALKGYANPRGIPAVLRDYQSYFWVSKKSKNIASDCAEFSRLREDIEAEFKTARLGFRRLLLPHFLKLVRRLTTPNIHTLDWKEVTHEPLETLNHQCLEDGTSWAVNENSLDVTYETRNDAMERVDKTTRIITLGIKKFPKEFSLWMNPDNFCNLFRAEKGITCPFMINLHFKVMKKSVAKGLASRKQMSSERSTKGSIAKYVTGVNEMLGEWKSLNDQLNDDTSNLCELFYGITLFSTPENAVRDESRAVDVFLHNGIYLYCPKYLQMAHFLTCLPFMMSEGLWDDLQQYGKIKKQSHWAVTNFLPIVAEFKGSPRGMLLPSFRNQMCFMDNFDDKHLPITNFNQLVIASSGSGKSVFCNEAILELLKRRGKVFVIDLGGSYKHLCELVGGDYIDASTLKLNPFTLFDVDDAETEIDGKTEQVSPDEMVRNLLAVMSNPHGDLLSVQSDWLLEAVGEVRKSKGKNACMDDLVEELRNREVREKRNDQRLYDLILSFQKYTKNGVHGHIFNGDTPLLNKKPFVVLEMGAFRDKPEIAKIVMFVMIGKIQSEFYNSPRDQIKSCFIDEAWRWLCEGDNTMAAEFIGAGFRTARKHRGSFTVIVQNLETMDDSKQWQAIKSCSDIKIILRQGDFVKYVSKNPDEFTALQETVIKDFGEAKNNGFSEMMINMGKVSSFHRFFLDSFKRVLFSSDGEEYEAVQTLKKKGLSLTDAVQAVSDHYYGGYQ